MNYLNRFQTGVRIPRALCCLAIGLVAVALAGGLAAQDPPRKKAPPAPSVGAESTTQFLGHLGKGDAGAAIGLWDSRMINDKLKERIDKMALKVKKAGGI